MAALRQARKARRPRARGTDRRGQIPNVTPMAERPAEVTTHPIIIFLKRLPLATGFESFLENILYRIRRCAEVLLAYTRGN